MSESIIIGALLLCIALPVGIFFLTAKKSEANRKNKFKTTLVVNIASFFTVLTFSTVFIFSGNAYAADTMTSDPAGMAFLAAALSTGLASIGAGIATGQAASSALGALSENEGIMGKALIFVALAEGIAIYGLIIAFMILNRV